MTDKVDSSFLTSSQNFIRNLLALASSKISTLPQAILGDFNYAPIQNLTYKQKKKITYYLQAKYLNIFDSI